MVIYVCLFVVRGGIQLLHADVRERRSMPSASLVAPRVPHVCLYVRMRRQV
jgi:hypothetical protein